MDSKVCCAAKGFYSYLCGYAGTNRLAFPLLSKIREDLYLSKSTIYKYANELEDNGYILMKNYARRNGCAKRKHYFIRYHEDINLDKYDFVEAVKISFNRTIG